MYQERPLIIDDFRNPALETIVLSNCQNIADEKPASLLLSWNSRFQLAVQIHIHRILVIIDKNMVPFLVRGVKLVALALTIINAKVPL